MRFLIIGLGNFGAALGERLAMQGHEVIGVDGNMEKVEFNKEKVTHAIKLDATDEQALSSLPIKETDVAIVAIGENVGASIMATALLKQLKAKRIIGRAINPLQETVLNAIGIDEIVHPEQDSAERLSKKLEMRGVLDSFSISDNYNIIETKVPERYVGKAVGQTDIRSTFKLNILTVMKVKEKRNLIGQVQKQREVLGVIGPDLVLERDDVLVIFGESENFERFLKI